METKKALLEEVLLVSEKLSSAEQLRLIGLLSERLRCKGEEAAELVDMLALAGLGAEVWREIDVSAYLEQERASWER